jgi:hypothetical protein
MPMLRLYIFAIAACILCVTPAFAEEHVVPSAELQQSLDSAAETRRQNEADLQRLVAHEEVQQAAEAAGIDPEQVREAIPQLDDETLAELAARARELEDDVAGGFIGGIIIILVLVVLLAVLLAVYVID